MIVQFCNNMGTRPLALVGGTCCVDVDGCDSGSVSIVLDCVRVFWSRATA